jgi:hypothetical protein
MFTYLGQRIVPTPMRLKHAFDVGLISIRKVRAMSQTYI